MNYEQTLHYLFNSTPVFQHSGAPAYKPGLDTSITLDNYFGKPHRAYRCIHVGGTNGKGSVCHTLAAVLQLAGYRVGLYTSPHLNDFRERIRVNGEMIDRAFVTDFVERSRSLAETLRPSFFELTSTMAFEYFRSREVDFAVIEVGLGGRLDSTNIISPILSVVTNISLDHTQLLGNTPEAIAYEKAGIIKPGIPAVLGDTADEAVYRVFKQKAEEVQAPLFRADRDALTLEAPEPGLSPVQRLNVRTILTALQLLAGRKHIALPPQAVEEGFRRVGELTGLRGRWEIIGRKPLVVLDTGHNEGAWRFLPAQIDRACQSHRCRRQILLVGFSADKDVDAILGRMPQRAYYLFTQASLSRALPAGELALKARAHKLEGETCPSVAEGLRRLKRMAAADDFVLIGGSNFVVADALECLDNSTLYN
jgi:dihydrofolate synthase/folylpolyglutamate synthase